MTGIYLYFVNKHRSRWLLLGHLLIIKQQPFILIQIENICRRQTKYCRYDEILYFPLSALSNKENTRSYYSKQCFAV